VLPDIDAKDWNALFLIGNLKREGDAALIWEVNMKMTSLLRQHSTMGGQQLIQFFQTSDAQA